MLKTKCFVIGGMILSSSLQAEVSEPVKKTGNEPGKLTQTEEDRRIEEGLEKDGRFAIMKRLGFDPEKLTRDEADRIIEGLLESKGRFDFIKKMGNDPEKLARTKKGIVEEEKRLAAYELIKEMNERLEAEEKISEIREREELKRKVEMHEAEIQRLKNQLKRIDYMLEDIMNGPILTPPPLPRSLRR